MPECPEGIYETGSLDDRAKEILRAGGKVYLTPPSTKETLPSSIQAQFTTDFWSVGTFPEQEGAMAQLLECRCGNGKLLFSSMGLQNPQQYPEAMALLNAIYRYMESERFVPEQEIALEVIEGLLANTIYCKRNF